MLVQCVIPILYAICIFASLPTRRATRERYLVVSTCFVGVLVCLFVTFLVVLHLEIRTEYRKTSNRDRGRMLTWGLFYGRVFAVVTRI